jgi:hypothetical protein
MHAQDGFVVRVRRHARRIISGRVAIRFGGPQPANHIAAIIVGAPSLKGKRPCTRKMASLCACVGTRGGSSAVA